MVVFVNDCGVGARGARVGGAQVVTINYHDDCNVNEQDVLSCFPPVVFAVSGVTAEFVQLSPTQSPTSSPTDSPTQSPTWSPTPACSNFVQLFTATEVANRCNPAPLQEATTGKKASTACRRDGPASIEDAFRVVWSSSTTFSSVSFDDIVDSITTTSVWTGSIWSHTFVIEYKPESPIDHITLSDAATDFANTVYNSVVYCGCSVTLSVTDEVQSSYNLDVSSKKSGKCNHAYTAPKAGKMGALGEWHEANARTPRSINTNCV
jgi:hypothetical protein